MFGTTRTPLSGSNSRHETESDSLSEVMYIECKRRKRMAIWTLFQDTENKAKSEGKIPLVALKETGRRGYLFVIRPEDLEKIALVYEGGEMNVK